jgi:hypothetical protein
LAGRRLQAMEIESFLIFSMARPRQRNRRRSGGAKWEERERRGAKESRWPRRLAAAVSAPASRYEQPPLRLSPPFPPAALPPRPRSQGANGARRGCCYAVAAALVRGDISGCGLVAILLCFVRVGVGLALPIESRPMWTCLLSCFGLFGGWWLRRRWIRWEECFFLKKFHLILQKYMVRKKL